MADQLFGEDTNNGTESHNYMVVQKDGSIDVNIQDQTTPPVALYFLQAIGAPTMLTNTTAIDDNTITVDDPTNFSVGTYLGITCAANVCTDPRFYFAEVLAVTGSVITFDTPLDYAFLSGSNVIATIRDMNVAGSLATPQIFAVRGAGSGTNLVIDITRINISIVSASQPDDGNFAGIDRLVNGIALRRKDGDIRNIWNIKDGSDMGIQSGIDTTYSSRSVPQGSYGTKARITYAGQSKHGVAIRLEPGDFLELLIQDDLSDLTSFRILAQGHIVN